MKLKNIGKESYRKRKYNIKNIDSNSKFRKKDTPYEDLFCMILFLETSFIKDKEYLNNYDLVNIPE